MFPALVLLYGAITLVSVVARRRWPLELLQHFRPQMIVAGAGGALFCFLFEPVWGWALAAAGLVLINVSALPTPRWTRPDAALAGQPGLAIVWANVWTEAVPLKRALDWAKAQGADIILIGEYPKGASPEDDLAGDYPHRVAGPAQTPGMAYSTRVAVFSRVPLSGATIHKGPGPNERDFVAVGVAFGEQELNIIAVHPVPPMTAKLTDERDKHISLLAPLARDLFFIAGDFNTTPWTPVFADIPGKRIGAYLFAPTWLSKLPLLGLPIDHMTASPSLRVSRYEVAPNLGSDHRALLARVHAPAG